MKFFLGLFGGGVGALFGFYLPVLAVLLCERGHETERYLAHFDAVIGGDTLVWMGVANACGGCWLGAWLGLRYPQEPATSPAPDNEVPDGSVWPPPPKL